MRRLLALGATCLLPLLATVPAHGGRPAPVRLPGPGHGEPSVAVRGRDAYVVAPGGTGFFWRSSDGGRRWARGAELDVPPNGSADIDVSVAPDDGTVYVVNMTSRLTNHVFVSRDRGRTFGGPVVAGAASDRPWIVAAPRGRSYVVFHGAGAAQAIVVLRSDDHGATYRTVGAPNLPLGAVASLGGTVVARPVVDPRDPDVVTVVYSGIAGIAYARTTDGGMTWQQGTVDADAASYAFPGLAVDAAGALYAVWANVAGGETHIELAMSTDGARTWRTERVDRWAGWDANLLPYVAAGAAGRVAVAWYAADDVNVGGPETEWHAVLATRSSRTPWQRTRLTSAPVRRGAICAGLCEGDTRNLLDFIGIATGSAGTTVAWAADTSGPVLTYAVTLAG